MKSPISNVGYVPVNLRLDQDSIENRQSEGAQGSLWPAAKMSDILFAALPREIALMTKTDELPYGTDGLAPSFSVLNGLGHGKTRLQVIEDLAFAGLVGSQGAKYDSTGSLPAWPDFAGKIGGIDSIINTGDKRIKNGELIYWDIPEEGDVPAQNSSRDGRILAATRPYRASDQSASAKAICEKLRKSPRTGAKHGDIETIIGNAAMGIKKFASTFAVCTLEMYLASGLVKFDPRAMGIDDTAKMARKENADEWNSLPSDVQEEYLVRVGRALRCDGMQDIGRVSTVQMPSANGCSMSTYLTALLTCDKQIVRSLEGTHANPSGDKGYLRSGHMGNLEMLLVSCAKAQAFYTSRVFARALTPIAPGMGGDINIGSATS